MPLFAPEFLMANAYVRKRVRDTWTFFYQATKGRRFVSKALGYELLFDTDNIVDKYVLAFGSYEPEQWRTFARLIAELAGAFERRVFVDIGAHWGYYTLLARSLGTFQRLVAVEADPRTFAQLGANLFLNRLMGEVEAHPCAASDGEGVIHFALAGDASRVVSQVWSEETSAGMGRTEVQRRTLDSLVDETGAFIALKIDVEGHETEVLGGAEKLLANNHCLLQIEVFDDALEAFDAAMARRGYAKITEVGNDRYYRRAEAAPHRA